jgi:hypothetical protein
MDDNFYFIKNTDKNQTKYYLFKIRANFKSYDILGVYYFEEKPDVLTEKDIAPEKNILQKIYKNNIINDQNPNKDDFYILYLKKISCGIYNNKKFPY